MTEQDDLIQRLRCQQLDSSWFLKLRYLYTSYCLMKVMLKYVSQTPPLNPHSWRWFLDSCLLCLSSFLTKLRNTCCASSGFSLSLSFFLCCGNRLKIYSVNCWKTNFLTGGLTLPGQDLSCFSPLIFKYSTAIRLHSLSLSSLSFFSKEPGKRESDHSFP